MSFYWSYTTLAAHSYALLTTAIVGCSMSSALFVLQAMITVE